MARPRLEVIRDRYEHPSHAHSLDQVLDDMRWLLGLAERQARELEELRARREAVEAW